MATLALGAVFCLSLGAAPAVDATTDLPAALDATRRLPAGPRTLRVPGGLHLLAQPLVLGPQDSGLTIEPVPGAQPILATARRLSGWERDGEHAWSCPAPVRDGQLIDFRHLLVAGRLRPRARLPRDGRLTHVSEWKVPWMSTTGGGWKTKPTPAELTTMRYKPGDLPAELDVHNAEVTVYHMWDESMVGVAAHDPATQTLTFSSPCGHPPGAFGVQTYVVWNTREGLTEPGQWYLDRTRGRVVYWPLPGEAVTGLEVLVPTAESVIRLVGTQENPVREVTLRGLTLTGTTTPLVAGGFGAGRFQGVVQLDRTAGCRLDGLTITQAGGQGIKVWQSSDLTIEGCEIANVGACGLQLNGRGCHVFDNRFHDLGLSYPSAIGVNVGGQDHLIEHNDIHHTPYTALACSGHDSRLEANRIHHAMEQLHDGAGIYITFCQRITARGNVVTDITDTGGYGASAYYLDEQAQDCLVEANRSVRVMRPSHNHMAWSNTIRNNLFIADGEMKLTFPKSKDFRFEHNVLVAGGKISVATPEAVTSWDGTLVFSRTGPLEGIGATCRQVDPKVLTPAQGDAGLAEDSPAWAAGFPPLPTGAGCRRGR